MLSFSTVVDIAADEPGSDWLDSGKKSRDVFRLSAVDLNGWVLVDVDGNFI